AHLIGGLGAPVMTNVSIRIIWKAGPVEGQIAVVNGRLVKLEAGTDRPSDTMPTGHFTCASDTPCRLSLRIEAPDRQIGAAATIIRVGTTSNPFSFFLRDVRSE